MSDSRIPERSSGRYAQQYAATGDSERLLQILTESTTIALQSKDPDTAAARYDLAVEAYHQLRVLNAHQSVHETVLAMVTVFPTQVRLNAATGLVAKAAKLKTPKRKADILRRALAEIERHPTLTKTDATCQRLARAIAVDLANLGVQ